jgi:hypothetical protein
VDRKIHGPGHAGATFRRMRPDSLGPEAAEIATGFGDGSVTLPDGMARPAHWPAEVLDEAAWEAARGAGA